MCTVFLFLYRFSIKAILIHLGKKQENVSFHSKNAGKIATNGFEKLKSTKMPPRSEKQGGRFAYVTEVAGPSSLSVDTASLTDSA